jgi:hemolysin III
VVWGLAAVGVVFENVATQRSRMISLVLYIGLGWLVAIAVKPFLSAVDTGGVILVALGGLAYTGGIVFYRWRELPYNHAVWHAAVLAGSAFHFFAILFYVMPRGVG